MGSRSFRLVCAARALLLLLLMPPSPSRAAEPTEPEARAWALRVEKSVGARDPSLLDAALDVDAFADRALAGQTLKPRSRADVVSGLRKSVRYGQQFLDTIGEQGVGTFLRVVRQDAPVAIFRFTTAKGGFGYLGMVLAQDKGGTVRVVDQVSFAVGERLSSTLRRGLLPLIVQENKSVFEKLLGGETEYVKHIREVENFVALAKTDKQGALALYLKLPPSVQEDRTLMVMSVVVAQAVGETEYNAALARLERRYGKDPAMAFVLLDFAIGKEDWPRVLATLDTIDVVVGGDPYLDYQRALMLDVSGNRKGAKAACEAAIRREPGLVEAHDELLGLRLADKDWQGAAASLDAFERLGLPLPDPKASPDYAAFQKTKEYQRWRSGRSKRR